MRLCRSRSLAAAVVTGGGVRINRRKVRKPAARVHVGDVITVAVHGRVHVVEVLGLSPRRVSATVAAGLYRRLPETGEKGAARATTRPRQPSAQGENRV